jgi:predicted MFS family arabinose efflux permease
VGWWSGASEPSWTANAALTALLVPFVVRRLHSPGQDVGYLVSGLGVGYLLGSAVSRPLVGRFPTRAVLAGAYLGVGASFVGLVNAPNLPVATGFTALAGVPGAIAMIATQHRLQADTAGTLLGRVSAAFATSDAVAAVTGAAAAPALLALTGLPATLNLVSAAVIATAAAVPFLLPPPASPDTVEG